MRVSILVALLLGLALAAPAKAQDASYYWPDTTTPKKPKPPPPPSFFSKVKKATAKALDYNTYLPAPGTTANVIKDPRLLPLATPSKLTVDAIDVLRPADPVKFVVK